MCLWAFGQILMIALYIDHPQGSDQGAYMRIAYECFHNGEWYPTAKDVFSSYIWAPGYINWLILQLHVFGTLKINMALNLMMSIGICLEVHWLCRRFFTERTANIAVIIYCLLYSNTWVTLPAGTEVPFLFLALSGFCLTIKKHWWTLCSAGILFFLANWIRPLVVFYMIASIIYMFNNKFSWCKYAEMIIPFLACALVIGSLTRQKIGYFNCQSTTGGVNLIMTCNDRAYGGVATSLLNDSSSTCYIADRDEKTFAEKDSIWKARSIEWIKVHPLKYAGLYALKLCGVFAEDTWADRPILGGDGFVDQVAHGNKDNRSIFRRIIHMASKSLVYYITLLIFIITLWKRRNEIFTSKGYVLLIFILGIGATCLFSVSPRYHYPFFFACVMWSAYGIDVYFKQRSRN